MSISAFVVFAIGTVVALRVQHVPSDLLAQVSLPSFRATLDVNPRDFRSDSTFRLDYDIVYVRAPRRGDDQVTRWTEIAHPATVEPGADLMLLHPDGREEELVHGGDGSVTDPYVSFDGQWVYYARIDGLAAGRAGPRADIYKIHVRSRRIVRLTEQPAGVGAEPVLNLGPCPLPGNRVAFVSSRRGFRSPKHSTPALQLFAMDDDGGDVELIGALNGGMALHPTILTDGRLVFSSLEGQGLRVAIMWGLWSINPDGTHWAPVLSAFDHGNAFHFQTQLSDGNIVAEEYYNQNNEGFGAYFKLPSQSPEGYALFGPANVTDPRNPPMRFGRYHTGSPAMYRLAFSPRGIESFTPFANNHEGEANPSVLGDNTSPRVGKFTHPSGAPGNDLLTVWSPGPVNHQGGLKRPALDAGIYVIRRGVPIDEPGQMLRIRNDPSYNEQWPRALVPYRRIYGIDAPRTLPRLANDGRLSPALPAGTPFGLIGASSLYKRETYPGGVVPEGRVTAGFRGGADPRGYAGLDPFNTSENYASTNWQSQGADAGRYSNDDIHAVRIVALEPVRPQRGRPGFRNHANERLRILGEIPVRKFAGGREPSDPDGNPDTSFLAKIPADLPFTFQTIDRNGMVLNMSQTWHQLRPGEVRTDCGGCHAHSQKPTPFELTRAGQRSFTPVDLTIRTPLVTSHAHDESRQQWDRANTTGLRFVDGAATVEYFRDIKPLLDRSCRACHSGPSPAGNLALDDDTVVDGMPGTYFRLARDVAARFGYKPVIDNGTWRGNNASRYIRKFQSRRSLLVWKILGRRLDGWTNDDFPTETVPGDATTLRWHGQPIVATRENRNRADLDYTGSEMPPPGAVTGSYTKADGTRVKVPALSDEERLTIVRWIDLGCPIDLTSLQPTPRVNEGWFADEQPPTLTVTLAGSSGSTPSKILVGMHDHESGLDQSTFTVTSNAPIAGAQPGENIAPKFRQIGPGVWELSAAPLRSGSTARVTVSVADRQGNRTTLDRKLSAR